jgi:hypothetical protein
MSWKLGCAKVLVVVIPLVSCESLANHFEETILSSARAYWFANVYGITSEAVRLNELLVHEVSPRQNIAIRAPLVNRSLLEYALPYVKLTTAAYSDFGLLEGLLNAPVRYPASALRNAIT